MILYLCVGYIPSFSHSQALNVYGILLYTSVLKGISLITTSIFLLPTGLGTFVQLARIYMTKTKKIPLAVKISEPFL